MKKGFESISHKSIDFYKKIKNSPELQKAATSTPTPPHCYTWNDKLWYGINPNPTPAFSECGRDKCLLASEDKCYPPKKVSKLEKIGNVSGEIALGALEFGLAVAGAAGSQPGTVAYGLQQN
jgi:hypothetical protein